MLRFAAAVLVGAVALTAAADDKKDDKKDAAKLSGIWVKEAEGFTLKFSFQKDDKAEVAVTAGENGIVISTTVKVEKDEITLTVTDVKEKGEFPAKPKKGAELKFKLKIDDKKATLSDFKGEDADQAKAIVEGEYTKKDD